MTVPLPPKLYFRIGEVAGLVGVEPHVLRYWEREFRSIRPTKSAKGQRVYSRKDVEALIVVKDLLYAQGFTIAGAKKRLQRAPDVRPTPAAAAPLLSEATEEDAAERALLENAPTSVTMPAAVAARSLGRHAEEALLRTLDPPLDTTLHLPRESHASAHVAAHAPVQHVAPQKRAVAQAAVTNGANTPGRLDLERTRQTLISLRAEVEALLSELGG